jgi:ParB-like chromosome segregation protein Spo0J
MTTPHDAKLMTIAPDTIATLPGNPNEMTPDEFASLCGSIERLGFIQTPTVRQVSQADRDAWPSDIQAHHMFIVEDGEHRVKAAVHLALRTIPVICVDHDVNEAMVTQIAMNRLRGHLDMTRTGRVLDELVEAGWASADLAVTGFSEVEIATLLDATREQVLSDLLDDSIAPPTDERPKTFAITINCGSDVLRARIRAALLERAGASGTILDGLLAVLNIT